MTVLVENLKKEVDVLNGAGASAFSSIASETAVLLDDLRALEKSLLADIPLAATSNGEEMNGDSDSHANANLKPSSTSILSSSDTLPTVQSASKKWYALSISSLKAYNHQIGKYVKNIATSPKYRVDLDSAYIFPLLLDSYPTRDKLQPPANANNRQELVKSIIVHFLKSGHDRAVAELLYDCHIDEYMDGAMVEQFLRLHHILKDLKVQHKLASALEWLQTQDPAPRSRMEEILLKLHLLQFVLCLNDDSPSGGTSFRGFRAYMYGKSNLPPYFKNYMNKISPALTLMLHDPMRDSSSHYADFLRKITQTFIDDVNSQPGRATRMDRFLIDLLQDFDKINLRQDIFDTLAHEFAVEFCGDMALPGESALFESVLAGFVNLPNFYKYSQLQKRIGRHAAEVPSELPFQLPDKNHFLFRHHPIFICPVSKEQLVPLSTRVLASEDELHDRKRRAIFVSPTEKLVPMANPVVVFDHCRHLALKDSVRNLTKGGTEMFKCHYCYKKHKLLDVSDAYFIDL